MKYSKWIGLAGIVLLVISCLLPWVVIESKNIIVTGLQTEGTNYGKPGLMNLLMCSFAGLFFLIPRVWAKRANLFFCAFNMAWAVRNYIIVAACYGGECPQKQSGLYLLLISSAIILLASLFPELKLKEEGSLSAGLQEEPGGDK